MDDDRVIEMYEKNQEEINSTWNEIEDDDNNDIDFIILNRGCCDPLLPI